MDPAQRRFQNDQERNKQATLSGPGSANAQSATRPTADNRISQLARPRSSQQTPNTVQNSGSVVAPGVVPQRPPQGLGPPAQTFDEHTQNLLRQVRMEKLLTSPEAQDANTIVSLRNFWNGRDPDHDRGPQVRSMLETYAPPD